MEANHNLKLIDPLKLNSLIKSEELLKLGFRIGDTI
jgi:hypothetical protein